MGISPEEFLEARYKHPVVDVRSPGEFRAGHIPGAINIPILNDSERKIVGTAYVQRGQREAIREGFRLVGPRLNDIIESAECVAAGKEILVHCWRGGMRSRNFSQFIAMAGVRSRALDGGYKAYRQLAFEFFKRKWPLVSLTGLTGSGKTSLLRELGRQGEQIVDLEGLANHKGSAFGGLMMPPQPTTEQFQNLLFEKLLTLDPSRRIWVEDESIAIGQLFLPVDFWNTMNVSPLVEMNLSKEKRVERLVAEYGNAAHDAFLDIMTKILKRLGRQHYQEAKEKVMSGDMASAIDILLTYYDKAYRQSIDKRKELVVEKLEWDGTDPQMLAKTLRSLNVNLSVNV